MTRRDDWQVRLAQYQEACARRPFQWGRWDCALFVADCVHAMTGVDWVTAWRGHYDSAVGAQQLLKARGYPSMQALVNECLGPPLDAIERHRGNVVAIHPGGAVAGTGEALGVIIGTLAAVPASRRGLAWVPHHRWLKEWPV